MKWRQGPVGVIQMCWIAPGPSISARVKVSPGLMLTEGEIFQPWPRSRATLAPVPSVAMPPLPFSPVKFSGLIERVFALESRESPPMPGVTRVSSPWAAGPRQARRTAAVVAHAFVLLIEQLLRAPGARVSGLRVIHDLQERAAVREAPPTRAPSTSAWAMRAADVVGLHAAAVQDARTAAAAGSPWETATRLRMKAWTSCACAGVATLPVPMAQTGS